MFRIAFDRQKDILPILYILFDALFCLRTRNQQETVTSYLKFRLIGNLRDARLDWQIQPPDVAKNQK